MSKDKKKKTLSIPPENPKLIQKGSSRKIEIYISDSANTHGDIVIASRIESSFNVVDKAEISNELKDTLKELAEAVANLSEKLPKDVAQELARDLEILISEATSKTPRRKWWQVATDGIIKIAEGVDEIGKPVLIIAARIVTILSRQ